DGGDPVAVDREVAPDARGARPVEDRAAAEDEVVLRGLSVVAAQEGGEGERGEAGVHGFLPISNTGRARYGSLSAMAVDVREALAPALEEGATLAGIVRVVQERLPRALGLEAGALWIRDLDRRRFVGPGDLGLE